MSVISLGRPLRVMQRASQGSRSPAEKRAIGRRWTCVLAARGNTQLLTAFFVRLEKYRALRWVAQI